MGEGYAHSGRFIFVYFIYIFLISLFVLEKFRFHNTIPEENKNFAYK